MTPSEVASTLAGVRSGDRASSDRLFEYLYSRLRQIGKLHLQRERAAHTLQPTALVHEAYLQLAENGGLNIKDRSHFLSIAAGAMRQVLVQHARRKQTRKRGGDRARVTFTEGINSHGQDFDLLDLDDALHKLEAESPRVASGVVMRFFGGLTTAEAAEALGVSVRTVGDDWKTARIWLKRELM